MLELTLFCKSYRNDLLRIIRLAQSIRQFNSEGIPFYVSVPEQDHALFSEKLTKFDVILLTDETILRTNSRLDLDRIASLPGGLSQQIVKSEFWRLGLSRAYVCLDSDCIFLRPFSRTDFTAPDGNPYMVMHEAKELLQFAVCHGQEQLYDDFHRIRKEIAGIFGREGRHFDFGPVPVIWDSLVWRALDEQFLQPRNMNFYDAIMLLPSELLWYGEAMLKFHPCSIMPLEPLFRVYHNERQYFFAQRNGENDEALAKNYLGVCYQSNWQKEFDLVKKPLLSRVARLIRRQLAKFR